MHAPTRGRARAAKSSKRDADIEPKRHVSRSRVFSTEFSYPETSATDNDDGLSRLPCINRGDTAVYQFSEMLQM